MLTVWVITDRNSRNFQKLMKLIKKYLTNTSFKHHILSARGCVETLSHLQPDVIVIDVPFVNNGVKADPTYNHTVNLILKIRAKYDGRLVLIGRTIGPNDELLLNQSLGADYIGGYGASYDAAGAA